MRIDRRVRTARTTVFLALITGSVVAQPSERWPRFRGATGDGVAQTAKDLPTRFGPRANVVWSVDLDPGLSSPIVWDDRVFITTYRPDRKELATIGIDRRDGLRLWRRVAPTETIEGVHHTSSPASATPVTDGRRVISYFGSYGLLAYSLRGDELWTKPLPMPNVRFGSGTSPILAKGRLILKVDSSNGGYLLALDPATGEQIWRRNRGIGLYSWSTPALASTDGGDEILATSPGTLTSYDLTDGTERWKVRGLPFQATATPVVRGGLAFINATSSYGEGENLRAPPPFDEVRKENDKDGDGKLTREEIPARIVVVERGASQGAGNTRVRDSWYFERQDRNRDGSLDASEWRAMSDSIVRSSRSARSEVLAVRLGGRGDVTATHVAWRDGKRVPEVPSMLEYEGSLYAIKNGGILSCRDPKTGREVFKKRVARGGFYASPVAGDGKVYIASDRGEVTVLRAGPTPEVLGLSSLGARISASPAIVDRDLFVRTDRRLFAFRELGDDVDAAEVAPSVFEAVDEKLAAPVSIVGDGATWSYFPGTKSPSAGIEWTAPEFPDGDWKQGPSGFGYGDDDDATLLPAMENGYTTLYIRRAFEVPAGVSPSTLRLSVLSDDGFVAYLNGSEVGRHNARDLPVFDHRATAGRNAAEPLHPVEVLLPATLLVKGSNTLAIMGMNQSKSSSDFSWHRPSSPSATRPLPSIEGASKMRSPKNSRRPRSSERRISKRETSRGGETTRRRSSTTQG